MEECVGENEGGMWESSGTMYYNKLNPHKGTVSSCGYAPITDEEMKAWNIYRHHLLSFLWLTFL